MGERRGDWAWDSRSVGGNTALREHGTNRKVNPNLPRADLQEEHSRERTKVEIGKWEPAWARASKKISVVRGQ